MTLDGHQDAVTCLNLTHDGMKIITGSLDYSLKFWDLSTGKVNDHQTRYDTWIYAMRVERREIA